METKEKIYTGTSGLTIQIAIKRLMELLDKAPLGAQDKKFYEESRDLINEHILSIIRDAKSFQVLRQNNKLTPVQWGLIYDEMTK